MELRLRVETAVLVKWRYSWTERPEMVMSKLIR